MQTFNSPAARDTGINSKISVPQGKQGAGIGLGNGPGVNETEDDSLVDTSKDDDGGFTGGLINPMIKVGK
jgi:hypothetical protein